MTNINEKFLNALFKTPQLSGAHVSPDSKLVAWRWANIGPRADIYLAPIDGSSKPKKITDFGNNTMIFSWSSDSSSLVVGHDYDGDERFKVYQFSIETEELIPLNEDHPPYFIARSSAIHSNGIWWIFGANYDFEKKAEIEPTCIYKKNMETGEYTLLAKPEKAGWTMPQMNLEGSYVLYERHDLHPSGTQIWLINLEKNTDVEILNFGNNSKVFASWHHNSADIVFMSEEKSYRKVGIYNVLSKETRWVMDDPKRNIEEAYVAYGSNNIVINEIRNAKNNISLLDTDTLSEVAFNKDLTLFPQAKLSSGEWVCLTYRSKQPADLVIYKDGNIVRSITNLFSLVEYTPNDLTQAESYSWQSIDGLTIQGWLYRPKIKSIGTIIYVHGGPTTHSEDSCNLDIQFLVSQGFTVLDPNYRGSTGFGLDFQESIKKDGWGGKEQEDILSGIKSLIKDDIAESGKIGITGTSYGGYSSWHAITHFPIEYIIASAPICGMTDLVVDYNTTRPDLRNYSEEMLGGSPEQNPQKYFDASPINFIKNIKGKLLIIQGAKDPNVTPENVKMVEKALIQHDIQYEKLIFDNEGHGISKPENRKVLLSRLVEFFHSAFK